MYKKIIAAILFSITVLSAGCGSKYNPVEDAKTSSMQQEAKQDMPETQEVKQDAGKTEQDAEESSEAEETFVTVSSVQVNKDTKSVCVEATISPADEQTAVSYSVAGVQVLRIESKSVTNGYEIRWYGFYEDESVCRNVKVGKTFSDGQTEYVESKVEVEEVPAKKFDATVGDTTVPVWITPFALLVSPTEDWRDEGDFYNLIAIDTSKIKHYICNLPMMDDRKPSQQKNDPLENLSELGEGVAFSVELEHCGVQSIFSENIDPDQIEQMEILSYHKSEL